MLDDILQNNEFFKKWLKHKHPADQPLSSDQAKKVWDKLKSMGMKPRLDPGHSSGAWKEPHINVEGTSIHIPVEKGFTP